MPPRPRLALSGLDIAAAVAGLIGGFASASTALMKWRGVQKNKAQGNPDEEEENLMAVLQFARRDVRKEYDVGLIRLGRLFQRGDAIGTNRLSHQVITFQDSVVAVL
jgi:hypothetical protein